ncbi:Golgi apparatus membrane protein tvp23 [Pseudocyphellaria aurata]|nr:Golgi apparatus membrane protein tvp23 [Pseudocyphellaria aurata]
MEQQQQSQQPRPGDLSWRLSSHPITLLCFLSFRLGNVLIFVITILLLATDFYYLKNIAGRRLVGLRWWNEVDTATGDSHWVFESQDRSGDASGAGAQNLTDKRFFWLALYAQPGLWVGLAIFAIVRFENPIWLSLVVIALVLTLTNTIAFSRCDRFSHASNLASSAMYSGGMARNLAGGVFSRMFGGNR